MTEYEMMALFSDFHDTAIQIVFGYVSILFSISNHELFRIKQIEQSPCSNRPRSIYCDLLSSDHSTKSHQKSNGRTKHIIV